MFVEPGAKQWRDLVRQTHRQKESAARTRLGNARDDRFHDDDRRSNTGRQRPLP